MTESRDNWERNTALLADDVQAWAEQEAAVQEAAARGWRVEREQKELSEEVVGGAYQVPVVTIHAPQGRLILEPAARGVLGAQGRVDLYAGPSLFRVMLLHQPLGKGHGLAWVVRTEFGIDWPQPWGRETFLAMAELLLKAGADPRIEGWMRLTPMHKARGRKRGDGPRIYELLECVACGN